MWLWELIKSIITVISLIMFMTGCALLGTALYHELSTNNNEYMFEKISRHVAEDYDYVEDVFDCSEFSRELYDRLVYAGYDDVRIELGCSVRNKTDETGIGVCHAWVVLTLGREEIYLESTSGEVLTKAYYLENYPKERRILQSTQSTIVD